MADLRVNARYILAQKYGEDSSAAFCTQVYNEAVAMPDYASHYKHIEQRCTAVYLQNKSTFIFLYIKGVLATCLDPGRFDQAFFFGMQDNLTQGFLHRLNTEGVGSVPDILKKAPVFLLLDLAIILLWNMVLCVAFIIFILHKKIDPVLRLLVFIFVGYIVIMTGISGLCRYRVPVYPEIVFAFTLAVPALTSFFKRKTLHA